MQKAHCIKCQALWQFNLLFSSSAITQAELQSFKVFFMQYFTFFSQQF